jgi:hypothetical protein
MGKQLMVLLRGCLQQEVVYLLVKLSFMRRRFELRTTFGIRIRVSSSWSTGTRLERTVAGSRITAVLGRVSLLSTLVTVRVVIPP